MEEIPRLANEMNRIESLRCYLGEFVLNLCECMSFDLLFFGVFNLCHCGS